MISTIIIYLTNSTRPRIQKPASRLRRIWGGCWRVAL